MYKIFFFFQIEQYLYCSMIRMRDLEEIVVNDQKHGKIFRQFDFGYNFLTNFILSIILP